MTITHIHPKLPVWFKKEKYDAVRFFTYMDWAKNLEIRSRLLVKTDEAWLKFDAVFAGDPRFEEIKAARIASDEEERKVLLPLVQEYGAVPHEAYVGNIDMALYDAYEYYGGANGGIVYPLPLWRAREISKSIDSESDVGKKLAMISRQNIFHHLRTEPLTQEEQHLKDWYENDFMQSAYSDIYGDYSFSPTICVELSAPDELLVEAFKSWLSRARTEQGKDDSNDKALTNIVTQSTLDKWTEYGVLPYLDLLISQQETGKKIPYHVIGDAIYANEIEIDVGEAVRKTTAHYARQAIAAVSSLTMQAIAEQYAVNPERK